MRSLYKTTILASIFLISILVFACSYDEAPEPTVSESCTTIQPTYEVEIEELLERTCSYEGCHVAGFSSGDYTTYEGLLPFIEEIEERTLLSQDMPPSNSPEGKPKSLTEEEKILLECWIANGFPEN